MGKRHAFHYDEEAPPLLAKQRARHNKHDAEEKRPIDLQNWMSEINDHVPVSAITIPGTHDSAARGSLLPFVTTQNLTIEEQLNAGIRYFDLRLGLINDVLQMVHGRSTLGLSLDSVLESIYSFLDEHPTEGLIAQIKRDRPDVNSTLCFPDAIRASIQSRPRRWRTLPSTPSMKHLRGRIQLFRRYHVDCTSDSKPHMHAYAEDNDDDGSNDTCTQGIDVSDWENNPSTPFLLTTSHGTELVIQDHYTTKDPTSFPALIDRKGGDISHMLKLAAKTHTPPSLASLASTTPLYPPEPPHIGEGEVRRSLRERWFLNFTSAFEINLFFQYTPDQIALGTRWGLRGQWCVGINPRLLTYLEAQTDQAVRRVRQGRRLQRHAGMRDRAGVRDEKCLLFGNGHAIPGVRSKVSTDEREKLEVGNYHNCDGSDDDDGDDNNDDDDDDDEEEDEDNKEEDDDKAHVKGIPHGIIIMDFPDTTPGTSDQNALLNAVVRTNFCLEDFDDPDDDGSDDDDDDADDGSSNDGKDDNDDDDARIDIGSAAALRRKRRRLEKYASVALFVVLCVVYLAALGLRVVHGPRRIVRW